jgi:hypothetical protein
LNWFTHINPIANLHPTIQEMRQIWSLTSPRRELSAFFISDNFGERENLNPSEYLLGFLVTPNVMLRSSCSFLQKKLNLALFHCIITHE